MKTTVMWAKQYSKRLITFLMVAWSVGAVIGVIYEFLRMMVTPETASMDSLYIYLAVPLTCGIPAYLIPNTLMNREKIKQNYIPNYDDLVLGGEYVDEDGIGTDNQGNTEEINVTGLHDYSEGHTAQSRYSNCSDF